MDGNTPVGVVCGRQGDDYLELAAQLLLRYTKAEAGAVCRVNVRQDGAERIISVANTMTPSDVERYIVA